MSSPGEASHEVKGSRFRAHCLPASSVEAAQASIARYAKEERRATHVCWAMRISGRDGVADAVRSHDAGEPSGTAGRPILAALEELDAWDAVVLVARNFGGVKLGAGGLKRAYHRVALDAVKAAEIASPAAPRRALRVRTAYADLAALERLLARHGAEVVARDFGTGVVLSLQVPERDLPELAAALPGIPATPEP